MITYKEQQDALRKKEAEQQTKEKFSSEEPPRLVFSPWFFKEPNP